MGGSLYDETSDTIGANVCSCSTPIIWTFKINRKSRNAII